MKRYLLAAGVLALAYVALRRKETAQYYRGKEVLITGGVTICARNPEQLESASRELEARAIRCDVSKLTPERAARQLLDALASDTSEKHLTLVADLAVRLHGAMPGLVADLARGSLLPAPNGSKRTVKGAQIAHEMPEWHDKMTTPGHEAAEKFQRHRYP